MEGGQTQHRPEDPRTTPCPGTLFPLALPCSYPQMGTHFADEEIEARMGGYASPAHSPYSCPFRPQRGSHCPALGEPHMGVLGYVWSSLSHGGGGWMSGSRRTLKWVVRVKEEEMN